MRSEVEMKELIFEIPDELLDHTAVVVHVKSGKELIRCKECKHCRTYYHGLNESTPFSYACDMLYLTNNLSDNDYCSRAERKEE